MFADFDLSSLRPFIIIGVVIIAALLKAFGKQKDDLDQPSETTSFPDESEGHKVIGRYPRREVTTAVPPPLPSPSSRPLMDWELEIERVLRGEPAAPAPPVVPPPAVRVPPPPIYANPAINESADIESAPAPSQELATLAPAADAYALGATVESRMSEHFRQVDAQIEQAASEQPRARSGRPAETEQVIALLRRPRTARQAILASVILSPPKALEA